MTRAILVRAFFFAALLFLLVQLYEVLASFLKPIAWSILLALVFQPVFVLALRLTRQSRSAAATLVTVAFVLLVAIPAAGLSGILAREGAALIEALSAWSDAGGVARLADWFGQSALGRMIDAYAPRVLRLQIDFASVAQSALANAGNLVVGYLGGVAKNLASFFINLLVVLFTVFFLLRDGDRMYETLRAMIPMEAEDKDAVLGRLRMMLEATVRGLSITAAVQGVLTGIGLGVAGVPYAAFLAMLAGVLSMLPFGTTLVWLPCAVYLLAAVSVGKGIFLVLWGTLVVGMADNVIRPMVIGGQAQLPTLLLFFGMLGGLEAYGFLGLFLGPALMATLAGFLEIYHEQYVLRADPGGPGEDAPSTAPSESGAPASARQAERSSSEI